MTPKIRGYVKRFDETKYMSIFVKDDELLKKYNKIWDKESNSIKKGFDIEPIYNKKYLKTEIYSYEDNIMEYLKKFLIAFV